MQHRERADAHMAQGIWNLTKARAARTTIASSYARPFSAADIVQPEFQARFRILLDNNTKSEQDTIQMKQAQPLAVFRVYDENDKEVEHAKDDIPPLLVTEEEKQQEEMDSSSNSIQVLDPQHDDNHTGLRQRRKKTAEVETMMTKTNWESINNEEEQEEEESPDHPHQIPPKQPRRTNDPKWLIAGGSIAVRELTQAEQHARQAMVEYIQTANVLAALLQTLPRRSDPSP
jgi:hypothetical protein